MISFICESKKMIQMNLFTKQKQSYRCPKQIYGYQRGNVGGRGKSGAWEEYTHSTIYKIVNQQEYTV